MKNVFKILSIAAAALFAGCNSDETSAPATPGNDALVRIHAETVVNKDSRANIEVNGTTFSGSWEDGDAMGVLYSVPGSSEFSAEPRRFVFNSNEFAFEGELPAGTGDWQYLAFYPHAAISGKTAAIPFGNLRTQLGNAYNCASDALVAEMLSFSNAERGKTDEGEPIKFRLNRLTSILNLSVKGGGNAGEKVRSVLLTSTNAEQLLSAQSLDFDISNMGAGMALNADGRSNVIALTFDPATAPAASDLEAYFNVLPGNYDGLTFDVITDAQRMGTVNVTRSEQPFEAGKLYQKEIADMAFAKAAAPSFDWPGQDPDEVHEITVDENNALTYSAAITIDAPAGIAALSVNATSDFLNNMMGITSMDLFNDEGIQSNMGELPFSEFELACTTQVQYKKSTVFDITTLVPMILEGGAAGTLHTFEVRVTDLAGQETVQSLVFKVPESTPAPAEVVYNNDANLWTNTATLTVSNAALATSVLEYQAEGASEWQTAALTANENGTLTATIAPTWAESRNPSDLLIYTPDPATGIFAQNTYAYQLKVNNEVVDSGRFTPENNAGDSIENSGMEEWGTKPAPDNASKTIPYPNAEGNSFWASGNNMYMSAITGGKAAKLCLQNTTKSGREGTSCAELSAQSVFSVFAAGNLFTGQFTMNGSVGYAHFGQKYTYSARPSALKLKYAATINTIDKVANDAPATTSYIDKARIFVCIIDWNAQHQVQSGTTINKDTFWDPETATSQAEGDIIGYGSYYVTASTGDTMEELTIPIHYYKKTDTPPTGNYTMIISCATSYLGDYLTGSYSNKLWVDDFKWVY
ncbi:PCMD domain-containing protein [Alistipes sp.]|uniref:PCMD domain-containing protein n=1 Tax=Alistipes sp. TaxID=1872444 RepID=UPI003AB52FDA